MIQSVVSRGFPAKGPAAKFRRFRASLQGIFLKTFARGRVNYALSFCSDAAAAILFLAWAIRAWPGHPAAMVPLAAAGFSAWGFSEYAFHRWAYHQERGILGEGHRMHHDEERALVAMPWFVSAAALFALWYAVAVTLRLPAFSALLAGWMAGAVLYSWVHHSHHHWAPRNAWMRTMRAHHRVHHRFPDCNFGVTTRLWDRVFGTGFKDRRAPQGS